MQAPLVKRGVILFAFVAQWIERLVPVQKVAGPIPAERTKNLFPSVPFVSVKLQKIRPIRCAAVSTSKS